MQFMWENWSPNGRSEPRQWIQLVHSHYRLK